jgi:O-antigen/teichoic acid export membrane protein
MTSLVNAGLPFLLLPVLTKYLSVEEYGLLAIIQVFISLTLPLITVNIMSTMQLEYHKLNKEDFATLVSSVLLIPVLSFIFITFGYFVLQSEIMNFMGINSSWIFLIPVIAFMQVIPQSVLSIYQISERPFSYAKYQISLALINFSATLILIILFKLGWEGRLLAIFLSYTVLSITGFYFLYTQGFINFDFKKHYITDALKTGGPLIIHVLSGTLFLMSDRLFVSYFEGNTALGLYSVGAQVAMIAFIIQQSFNQAWVPYLFKNLQSNSLKNNIKIVKVSYLVFIFFLILPFAIKLLSYPIFSFIIDAKFYESIQYVFWIALGYSFLGMYKVVTNYIFYEKRTGILSLLTFSSLCLNLILNYFFIKIYGTIGVAYATALTIGFFFIIVFITANKLHPMPWFKFKIRINNKEYN